ncbi:MAG TPA: OmpA family protein [Usitatibacter sp.]|nr:OmpA family protein [Usitatibacter sp.]
MRSLALVAVAALVAACASAPKHVAPEMFAVVPGAEGHVGTIVVHPDGGPERVIHEAYGVERIRSDGSIEDGRLSEAEVKEAFGPTLAALPGRPATFTLYFLEGKDELTPESKVEMDRVLAELKRRPLPDILVIGHSDSVGGLTYNDKLSLARAERVREMMIGMGIPADRVQAAGRGKRELLVPTDDNVSEARNRRVEINVR